MLRLTHILNKILKLLGLSLIYYILGYIPLPGINTRLINTVSHGTTLLSLDGSGLSKYSMFTMNISPYIVATIIMQILSSSIGVVYFNQLKKSHAGRIKFNDYTQYCALITTIIQGSYLAYEIYHTVINKQSIVLVGKWSFYLLAVSSYLASTMIMIWLSSLINKLNMGQGISIMIAVNIIASLPSAIYQIFILVSKGLISLPLLILIAMILAILSFFVLFVESTRSPIYVCYPQIEYNNSDLKVKREIPLKINNTGILPIMMTSAIIKVPSMIFHILEKLGFFVNYMRYWIDKISDTTSWVYYISTSVLIFMFIYTYSDVSFNGDEVAESLGKSNVIIDGVQPMGPTAKFLKKRLDILNLLTWLMFVFVSIIPEYLSYYINKHIGYSVIHLGGTSFLILIGVLINVIQSIKLQIYNYNEQKFKYILPRHILKNADIIKDKFPNADQ